MWYFYRYQLVFEYYDKPALVPPLTPLAYIANGFWYIRDRCQRHPCPRKSNDDAETKCKICVNITKNLNTPFCKYLCN